jgi:hypothetical protein
MMPANYGGQAEMSLISDVETLLKKAGYRITPYSEMPSSIAFEDDSVFGFVAEYDSVRELRDGWKKAEQNFLALHAPSLQKAAQKAWNCYSVHITSGKGSEEEVRSLLTIEEDFGSTRKIARSGLLSRKDLSHALAPLLPLQNIIDSGQQSSADLEGRLHEWPQAAVHALASDAKVDEIVMLLLEEK